MRQVSNLWTKRSFAGLFTSRLVGAALAFVAVLAAPAQAQDNRMTPIATPSQPNAIEIGTGSLPGAKNPESWHSQYGSRFARNVTVATLTPFLPDPAKASGAAVVVAPGGGNDAANDDNPLDAQYCRPNLTGRDIYQQTFVRNPRRFSLPGGYQGTSMAAPHVSATAALIMATGRLGKNPKPGRVSAHLRRTARDLGPDGYDTRYGHGLIDAAAALR